jgi:UDP-N-acetylglucosamine 1-carboxyvinyltransferase
MTTNQKIGKLIYQIRNQRGMTQAAFARKLGTSQSAVNRMEKGNQNLSLETIARISDVLQKPLISISDQTINFRIEGGKRLSGSIKTKTAKNSAVSILCASLLNKGTTKLMRVPRIEEVNRIIDVLESLGVKTRWFGINEENLEIKRPENLDIKNINAAAAMKTRSAIMLAGSLMHEFKTFRIPYAGGCKLGKRSIRAHEHALGDLGLTTEVKDDHYLMKKKNTSPVARVTMYEMGETPTENILIAASKINEKITIKNAASNYNVQETCYFLQKLGIEIDGIGTANIDIKGIPEIRKNISYYISEDPLDSIFFITAAIVTNSELTVERCPIDFLEIELMKLSRMGLKFKLGDRYKSDNDYTNLCDITIYQHNGKLKALDDKIHPLPFPGLLPDNLSYFVTIAAVAQGTTLIHDWMYENRAIYFTELSRLGANIELIDAHRVYVHGPTKFHNADITCPPALRPAAILLIAMLAAPGSSTLRNVYSINRGYENIATRLNQLGAEIEIINEI